MQRFFVLEDDSELSGTEIKNPEQNFDQQTQEPIVTMEFTDKGRNAFARVTKRIAQRGSEVILPPGSDREAALQRFAITLDNKIVSLATIDFRENPEGIDGRTGAQINGIGSTQETQDLAESLRIGALPIDLKLISQTQVSASLGQQALDQGLLAGGVGLLLTIIFLLIFYRVLGAVAATTLVIYALLLFALVKLIPITLTLPGIAGMVLTLAVAADANIVIFERIKEEARAGRSIPAAISNGYTKALRTIIDANVVTIGVAFILFMLATAGVKGFAFTLGIGTIVSLFTAVLATSAILGAMARTRIIGSRFAIGATEREGLEVRLRRALQVVLLGLGTDPRGRRARDRRARPQVRHRLRVGHPDQDPGRAQRRRRPGPRRAGAARPRGSKIQKVDEPDLGRNVFQIATPRSSPARWTRCATRSTRSSGWSARTSRRTRSGRRSARRSPARR